MTVVLPAVTDELAVVLIIVILLVGGYIYSRR